MTERINIHEHVAAICDALGLETESVARLDVRPGHVTAELYIRRDGKPYIDPDTDEVPMETREFEVSA